MQQTPKIIKNYLEKNHIGNIKFLENETIVVKDIPVHCGTLWTNMNNFDIRTMRQATFDMNDYSKINTRIGDIDVQLRPSHTIHEYADTLEFLRSAIKNNCIVVTHHAPHFDCLEYTNGSFDFYYASDLENFIVEHPQIQYWIHGHLHTRKNIDILNTKVVSNCRGYIGHESMANTFETKYFEVN
jgi:Icc-related predicted phosphoesterase